MKFPINSNTLMNLVKKRKINQRTATHIKEEIALDIMLNHLEFQFDGDKGEPVFDKYKIAQYMVDEGFRDPIKAYEQKYKEEFLDNLDFYMRFINIPTIYIKIGNWLARRKLK